MSSFPGKIGKIAITVGATGDAKASAIRAANLSLRRNKVFPGNRVSKKVLDLDNRKIQSWSVGFSRFCSLRCGSFFEKTKVDETKER